MFLKLDCAVKLPEDEPYDLEKIPSQGQPALGKI